MQRYTKLISTVLLLNENFLANQRRSYTTVYDSRQNNFFQMIGIVTRGFAQIQTNHVCIRCDTVLCFVRTADLCIC